MKIEKVYPAGWKVTTEEETYYFGEYGRFGCYGNDGVVYKDQEAFDTGEGVCYINEYGFENDNDNMGPLFEFTAKEAVASDLVGNSYVAISGYTRADLEALCKETHCDVEDLFDHLDWMCPETLLEEWARDYEENESESSLIYIEIPFNSEDSEPIKFTEEELRNELLECVYEDNYDYRVECWSEDNSDMTLGEYLRETVEGYIKDIKNGYTIELCGSQFKKYEEVK